MRHIYSTALLLALIGLLTLAGCPGSGGALPVDIQANQARYISINPWLELVKVDHPNLAERVTHEQHSWKSEIDAQVARLAASTQPTK